MIVVLPVIGNALCCAIAWWSASNMPRIGARGIWEHAENWTYLAQNDAIWNVASLAWVGMFLAGLLLWRRDFLYAARWLAVIRGWRNLAARLGVEAWVFNRYSIPPESAVNASYSGPERRNKS